MHRPASLLLALLLLLPVAAAAQPVQRIAAVVNQDIISDQDLTERLRLVVVTSGLNDAPEIRERLAPQVLRGLIDESLQMQEARRLGLAVLDEEIDEALESVAARNNLTRDGLVRALLAEGVSERTLTRQIEAQVAWFKVIGREIGPRITVSEEQIEIALREMRQSQSQAELRLAEIVLPVYEPSQDALVAQDARRLIDAMRQGATFSAIASQFSASASAEDGGDLGWVPEAAIPPDLRDELARLQPGQLSPPIRTPVGYYIFLLRDRRQAAARGQGEQRVSLAQILFPLDGGAADGATLEALMRQAEGLRPRLSNCADVSRVAAEIDAPLSGELGWMRLGDLPGEIAGVLASLPESTISPPLRGPAGIQLVMVCDRDAPAVSEEERMMVEETLEREQLERWVRRYLRDLRMAAYIDVRI
jgi:peptidyl-prolyl cis-trans isomerase SurA